MKILHLAHQYYPDHVGGVEHYTQSTAQQLARRGHAVGVFYRRFGADMQVSHRLDDDGVQVWAAQAGPMSASGRFVSTFKQAPLTEQFQGVLAEWQPDLVHLEHLMGLPVALPQLLVDQNIPYLITLHDYWWVCANAQLLTNYSQEICDGPQAYLNCARCALTRAGRSHWWPAIPALAGLLARRNQLLRRIIESARQIIAPTAFVRDWYVAHGLPAGKIELLPHGLETPPSLDQRTRQPGQPLRVAYIGGLSHQKGVHVLVDAFNRLLLPAELWIAGDDQAFPDYAVRLREDAGPGVRFLGKLSRAEVWRTLAQVDVVVVPSLWYETFSFIVSEAFAARVPVIASNIGPLAARVLHDVNGLLVHPGHADQLGAALHRLQTEPDLWPRLQAGIQPPLSLAEHIDRLETIYRSMLA